MEQEGIELADHSSQGMKSLGQSWINSEAQEYIPLDGKDEITYKQAVKIYVKLALPSAIGMMIRRVPDMINYIVAGHLGDPAFVSAIGLSLLTNSVLILSIGNGLAGGLETLSAHAFGSGNNYIAGQYYWKAQVMLTILFIPQAILLLYASDILLAVGQPVRSAQYAGQYLTTCIVGIWCHAQTECLRRFLGTQGVFHIVMNSQLVNSAFHSLWIFLFVYVFDLSFQGIALASCLTYILNFVVPIVWIRFNKSSVKEGSWQPISKQSFQELGEYLRYGIPTFIMLAWELWSFEILGIMAGLCGEEDLAAFVTAMNVIIFLYMAALGFQMGTNAWVGNSLGAGKPKTAKVFANISVYNSILLWFLLWGVVLLFRFQISGVLMKEEDLRNKTAKILALLLGLCVGDYFQGIAQGNIKAMGYQKYGTVIWIIAYWFIQTPITILLGFTYEYGIEGISVGSSTGVIFAAVSFLIIIYTADFEKISHEVEERLRNKPTEQKEG